MEEELLYRNHFSQMDRQMDRQTAMVKPVYFHNFVSGGIQTYFQCWEIVEKWPPMRSNFHGASHFFTTCGSKFNVKIWTVSAFNVEKWPGVSLLTLKNDPGSHFSTGSLFNVTPAYGVFISQLIRYAQACTSYECFILRARRLSSKLLKQGYLVERLKSSFRKFYGRYGDPI